MIIAAFLALAAAFFNKKVLVLSSLGLSLILLMSRIILLQRPPVATLGESAVYVAVLLLLISFYIPSFLRVLSALAAFLFFISPLSEDPLQPVLRSSFWLLVHVLTIVTSYGLLLAASVVGHFLLVKESKPAAKALERLLSWGTIFLIGGTLLGGIWASQSWGRFWDWDPKETWAFVSASLYLIALHAVRFGKISTFGLALFAVLGGAAITFTWYGLNVLIAKGLHSYGFTEAPVWPYLAFLLGETLFCSFALGKKLFAKK